jgi:hypothetical protein
MLSAARGVFAASLVGSLLAGCTSTNVTEPAPPAVALAVFEGPIEHLSRGQFSLVGVGVTIDNGGQLLGSGRRTGFEDDCLAEFARDPGMGAFYCSNFFVHNETIVEIVENDPTSQAPLLVENLMDGFHHTGASVTAGDAPSLYSLPIQSQPAFGTVSELMDSVGDDFSLRLPIAEFLPILNRATSNMGLRVRDGSPRSGRLIFEEEQIRPLRVGVFYWRTTLTPILDYRITIESPVGSNADPDVDGAWNTIIGVRLVCVATMYPPVGSLVRRDGTDFSRCVELRRGLRQTFVDAGAVVS